MLLAFDVQNHLSFKDPVSLNALRLRKSSGAEASASWDDRVSPVIVIYGPNASGKSNLLDAMSFVRHLVLRNSVDEDQNRLNHPFRLDKSNADKESRYIIRFIASEDAEQREFVYELGLMRNHIRFESLVVYRTTQPTQLFMRVQESAEDEISTKFNRAISKIEQKLILKVISPEKTILSAASLIDESSFAGVHSWFFNNLRNYDAPGFESEHERIKRRLHEGDESFHAELLSYLKAADLGICSIELNELDEERQVKLRAALLESDLPAELIDKFLEDQRISISLSHSSAEGKVTLPFALESDGTKAMLSFGSIVSTALSNGNAIIVDEIDTSLHPMLVRYLVGLFISPTSNPHQAQLIVTTHDIGLISSWPMEEELLDKDQIWFVEKDHSGASSLYSLADFSPRRDENVVRRYLLGHYGAIPKVATDA